MVKIDVRKLISFGKGSYIISMPKAWVEKNKLKKGDLISVDDGGYELVLRAGSDDLKSDQSEVTIDSKGKSLKLLEAEIVSSYLNCHDVINILFDSTSKEVPAIKEILRNLSGLEIMEQTSTRILAKNLINISEISISTIIRRMDIITRAMMEDGVLCCRKQATYESIEHRDVDVNRIFFLGSRIIKHAIKNPRIAKSLNTDAWKLHSDALIIMRIEKIADRQKRIARYLSNADLDRQTLSDLERAYTLVNDSFINVMKAYYSNDKSLAYTIEISNKERIKMCDDFLERHTQSKGKLDNSRIIALSKISNNLKATAASIKNMARTVLCYE